MKRANGGTKLQQDVKHPKPPEPAAQTGTNEHDARADASKLHENQRELGVDEEHKTDAMEQGNRGTFP